MQENHVAHICQDQARVIVGLARRIAVFDEAHTNALQVHDGHVSTGDLKDERDITISALVDYIDEQCIECIPEQEEEDEEEAEGQKEE